MNRLPAACTSAAFTLYLALAGTALCQVATPQAGPPQIPGEAAGPVSQSIQPVITSESPFQGGVPLPKAEPGVIDISLSDAIDRGLRRNLGLILNQETTRVAAAVQRITRAALLPNITASVSATEQQINLQALGFSGALLPIPIPPIVGPFPVFDARAFASAPILDFPLRFQNRSAAQSSRAARLSYQDARDVVVLAVSGLYLQAVASRARISAAEAQLNTALALYNRAVNMKTAGVVAGIDVLRAQVQMQAQQQRVIFYRNQYEIQKLAVARAIGLATGQEFRIATQLPDTALPPLTLDEALSQAYRSRSDYQSSLAAVSAAELTRRAAQTQRYPAITATANYGTIGPYPYQSHGTFAVAGAVSAPIFDAGRISADVEQADAALAQRRAEADDLRASIYYQVRTSFLDLAAAAEQVAVAKSSVQLAAQTLTQAQDRFSAGVTNNIEVIQAQEAVATADENLISSLYQYDFAKASLARSLGAAEKLAKQFLGTK